MLSIGPKATLRQIDDISKLNEDTVVVPQKTAKAITAKIIEVKPYKWVEVIDNNKKATKSKQKFCHCSWSGVVHSAITAFLEER